MQKVIIILFIFMSIYLYGESGSATEIYTIPTDSIRMRVIANSDEAADQIIKYDLVNSINEIISTIETNSSSIEESRDIINESIPLIESKLDSLNISGTVNYGYNYFPDKLYKSVSYGEGEYESLVITIGSGLGENWWCVLFPPLCLMETEETNLDEVEYSLYVKNIIEKYF